MSAISDKYAQLGGAAGFLGSPLTGEIPAANGGLKQEFHHGTIYWHPRTGAFETHGLIRAGWLALGAEGGIFGYPISDEMPAQDGVGRFNNFENASFYWQPSTGAYEVHGRIRDRWREIGGELSLLGYPVIHETATPDGVGRYNDFQNGSIYWSPATGAHEILYGPILARWAELRRERGLLAYPTAASSEEIRSGITFQVAPFQHGRIEVNKNTGRVLAIKFATVSSPNYIVPVVAFRVSDSDGSNPCSITIEGVKQWIDEANRIYAAAGIQFIYDGVLRDLRDSEVNRMTGEKDLTWESMMGRLNQLAAKHRSVVLVHRALAGGGFSSPGYDFVAMSNFDPNALSLLGHELGHHLGLGHTFNTNITFRTLREAEDYIFNGGSLDALDGDRSQIKDTFADPLIEALANNVSFDTIVLGGLIPLVRKNVMSYWGNHGNKAQLSHDQIDVVRRLVLERGSRYLDVTKIPENSAGTVKVPNVVGSTRRDATAEIEAVALVPEFVGNDTPQSLVFRQRPEATKNVPRGSTVTCTLRVEQ